MARPFLSLLVAAVTSSAGLALTWSGASARTASLAQGPAPLDPLPVVTTLTGVVLILVAAASLAIHWVGALVVGSVHALLGLLALVAPFGNPFGGGIFSPVFQITRMLGSVERSVGDGATIFYFSGTALVVGTFLAAAALGTRSRRLSGWSSRRAVAVSSILGGALLALATALLLGAGGALVRSIVQLMKFDVVAAGLAVLAGVLAGVAGLLLRWTSLGTFLIGVVAVLVGVALFVVPGLAFVPGSLLAPHGVVMVVGVTFVGAALGGLVRSRSEVEDPAPAL